MPSLPAGSGPIAMSVFGAVVMPRSLFLHSEVIQSQHFEGKGEAVIQERLRYEFADTLFSMIVGWAINSAMVIFAATTFFQQGIVVDDLAAAADTLSPILGSGARLIFALVACLLVEDSFQGLLVSQALLSLQLPIAVFLQIYLTSSSEVMGAYANSLPLKLRLLAIGIFVAVLDVLLML